MSRGSPPRGAVERAVEGLRAAGLLGLVHRRVRVADERVDVPAVVGPAGDADAGAHVELEVLDPEDRRERLGDAPRRLEGGIGAVHVGEQHGELVAPEPGDRAALGNRVRDPRSHVAEQHVPDPVAEAVVDLLEAVEVHDHHRQTASVAGALPHRLLRHHPEVGAVGQPGERVVQGVVVIQDGARAAEVHRGEREEDQRQQGEAEVGGHHHHGRKAQEHRRGGGLEDEVVAQVADDRRPVGERARRARQAVVHREQGDAREHHRGDLRWGRTRAADQ